MCINAGSYRMREAQNETENLDSPLNLTDVVVSYDSKFCQWIDVSSLVKEGVINDIKIGDFVAGLPNVTFCFALSPLRADGRFLTCRYNVVFNLRKVCVEANAARLNLEPLYLVQRLKRYFSEFSSGMGKTQCVVCKDFGNWKKYDSSLARLEVK